MAAETAPSIPLHDTNDRARRVMARCDELATFSSEPGHITRPYGTPALTAAMARVAAWMRECGLDIRRDAIGNLRGRSGGSDPAAPALLLGSHLDSVRDAGRYDGILGVLVALAVMERLHGATLLPFPLEIVVFPDEEGLRYQTTYLGSSALAGTFDPALLDLTDAEGISMRQAVTDFAGDPELIAGAALRPGEAFAYVEVHIEQGPQLEASDAPVGVVTAISGQTRVRVTFSGEAGHAGTVPMALRRDALPAAAELVLAAEALARQTAGLIATCGMLEVRPGASNVIPGQVALSLDVRHPNDDVRENAVAALAARAQEIATARTLGTTWQVLRDHPAVACDLALADHLEQAVTAAGAAPRRLASGAGHDAVVMASALPVAMLFVRCAGGVSHHPAESVAVADVAAAIAVLDRFVEILARERRP